MNLRAEMGVECFQSFSGNSFLYINLNLHFLCVYCMCLRGSFHNVWRSEDSLREAVLFYHVGPGHRTWVAVVRLGGQCLTRPTRCSFAIPSLVSVHSPCSNPRQPERTGYGGHRKALTLGQSSGLLSLSTESTMLGGLPHGPQAVPAGSG